jgi:hypothetical protein
MAAPQNKPSPDIGWHRSDFARLLLAQFPPWILTIDPPRASLA